MKGLILTFIYLAVVSSSAMANWVFVGTNFRESDEPLFFTFIDPRIEVMELKNIVKIKSLNKFANIQKGPNQKSYLSMLRNIKFDCQAETMQILSVSIYSNRNGEGEASIINNNPLQWIAVSSSGRGIEKKLFKAACTTLSSNPIKIGAKWASIGMFGSEENLYVIPASVRKTKTGDLMNLWGMTDRKIASSDGILSIQWFFQFDCNKRKYDMLDITSYSRNMGSGEVIGHVSRGRSWRLSEVEPDGVTEKFYNYACYKW